MYVCSVSFPIGTQWGFILIFFFGPLPAESNPIYFQPLSLLGWGMTSNFGPVLFLKNKQEFQTPLYNFGPYFAELGKKKDTDVV